MDKEEIESDFKFLKDDERVLGILLFGSHVTGRAHEKSDIDICVVSPETDPMEMMRNIWRNLKTEKYDVHTFEELPLKIKHRIIENHEIIWTRDRKELKEYMHRYRKIWNDTAKARGIA